MTRAPKSWLAAALAALALVGVAGCGSSSDGKPPTLTGISVSPKAVPLAVGGTQQLTVQGRYSDGSVGPVSGASFASSATSVATVSATGLVAGVAAGSASITASTSGLSDAAAVTVAAPPPTLLVFGDDYATGVTFQAFGGSTNAVAVDTAEHHSGTASLRIGVPASGYTGGALVAAAAQNLTAFNAVTFWVKASKSATLNVAGLGNDAGAGPSWSAEITQVPLTTAWAKYVVPIPAPAKATAVAGLFHLAEGADEGAYTIWLDDVQYENLPAASLAPPTGGTIAWNPVNLAVSQTAQIPAGPNAVAYSLPALPDGGNLKNVAFRWFTLSSSAPAVATVSVDGLVTGVAAGSATLTAKLGALDVPGSAAVTVVTTVSGPTTVAPAPTAAAADVISLFSSAYTSRTVDTWRTTWSPAGATLVDPYAIPGASPPHDVKKYAFADAANNFVGIEFIGTAGANEIDATGMTHFHIDVWTPDATNFQVKLVDFGADAAFGGGDDTEAIYTITGGSTPPLAAGQWLSYDIPLSAFTPAGATWNRAHLAQMLFISGAGTATVYVDNVYFRRATAPTGPTTVAPVPTAAAADVISLLSSAYTSRTVDTWRTTWSPAGATLVDPYAIPGASPPHDVKKYAFADAANNFVGIEFIGTAGANEIDATGMTHFHIDVWTPDATNFQVKLVDFGADAAFGGGDDTEAIHTITGGSTPPLAAGQWLSYDIPLSAFTPAGATWNRAHLAQMLFISGAGTATVYVDNVYFHR